MVDEVAGREDARAGSSASSDPRCDVAVLVELDLAAHDLRLRLVADRDERALDLELALGAVLRVREQRAVQRAVLARRANSFTVYGVSSSMFSVALARSSMIGEARNSSRRWMIATWLENFDEEDRLLHRRVAAADDHRRDVAEESRIAGRAVADAAAGELLLAGDAELFVLGSHRQHTVRARCSPSST